VYALSSSSSCNTHLIPLLYDAVSLNVTCYVPPPTSQPSSTCPTAFPSSHPSSTNPSSTMPTTLSAYPTSQFPTSGPTSSSPTSYPTFFLFPLPTRSVRPTSSPTAHILNTKSDLSAIWSLVAAGSILFLVWLCRQRVIACEVEMVKKSRSLGTRRGRGFAGPQYTAVNTSADPQQDNPVEAPALLTGSFPRLWAPTNAIEMQQQQRPVAPVNVK